METKTYLYPSKMRKATGYPYKFVIRSKSIVGDGYRYCLGIRSSEESSRTTISKQLYDAFMIECKANHKKFVL